ncbi:RNA-binding protein 34-like [Macrosteles quadrilineatus]|uniref:RNA-binding protein 34-like n=1 Tax=Macrosteles quadrilineatus TaxID=74068 RepID=UPI0023E1956C|nr:RNA-binding protein 34-like [Macrosteles quadrilineatus]XP_054265223.1 RNA-binding protein 34-like [Macrosteles quadrilineatus]XP_054265224.1 RNA-binding protein 34-like [Macrosteles quadrilineatus]
MKMNHKPKENVENTIFVGNIPKETMVKELKKVFRKFGPIINLRFRCAIRKDPKIPKKQAVIKKDFHEESNHINAFIKFQTSDSCMEALKMNGELFGGHHLRVTLAEDSGKTEGKKSVFIGNLAFKAQDDDLWSAFEDCGCIESVRVVRDIKTGIGKGFGYVNFKSEDAVELALKLNGTPILDRNIRVSRVAQMSSGKSRKDNAIKRVKKKLKIKKEYHAPSSEQDEHGKIKVWEKVKTQNDYQGQKSKPSHQKKVKKKKKFDKKAAFIKQIAQGLSKKNK